MKAIFRTVRNFFVSMRLTVALLVFGMVLIFAATIDQVNLGIWAVQQKYFHSFVIYVPFDRFAFPAFPGGYTIGGLLLVNLVAAHVYRFKLTWRKLGIQLTHSGLILLLLGELVSGLWQRDYHLRLNEGDTKAYAESYRDNELVFIDTSNAAFDEVVAIPEDFLAEKKAIQHPKLPFRVETKTYYPNSTLQVRADPPGTSAMPKIASTGVGEQVIAIPAPVTYRPTEVNLPTAFVEITGAKGIVGTFLVSTQIVMPQVFIVDGRTWQVLLRPTRVYYPFALTLLKFSHDRYAGTDIPKNFSSRLRLTSQNQSDSREVLIYMNNPLRHEGLTFYQAGFENNDRTTILQVVRNPSWILPYVACGLMSFGLILQFGMHLFGFIRQRGASQPSRGRADRATSAATEPTLIAPHPTVIRATP